jgi:predicted DNA-binding protein
MLGVEIKQRVQALSKYTGKSMSDIMNDALLKEVEMYEERIRLTPKA